MLGTDKFKRSLQWTLWSCGPNTVFAITRHFGVAASYAETFKELGCTWRGTRPGALLKFLRNKKLLVTRRARLSVDDVKAALSQGAVILAYTHEDHYITIHGWSDTHAYIADPLIFYARDMRQPLNEFMARWSGWGLVVSAP